MKSNFQKCYCAFCKHQRNICTKKHISFINVVLSLLIALLLMFVLWGDFDARVVLLAVIAVIVAETFILLRWRLTLSCPYCGFDPILYKHSPDKCAKKVKQFIDNSKEHANYFLNTKNPVVHLKPLVRKSNPSLLKLDIASKNSETLPVSGAEAEGQ